LYQLMICMSSEEYGIDEITHSRISLKYENINYTSNFSRYVVN
jgi:hypothetical protein